MKRGYLYILSVLFMAVFMAVGSQQAMAKKRFVLVIDPGHGGHDPGAIGRISKEKDINLNVALRLGQLVRQHCPDVKLIFTRKTDVFIPLNTRADIANRAKADLFISVHTNSVGGRSQAVGASTWTLGLARSEANLAVAKRENSVILYENDYTTRYAGFDPNSSESYIIFEFMQDKFMAQSVRLASLVQKEFKQTARRSDRGVHQAGFLVLKATAMPSILVELGFISTPGEERYLNSQQGINDLAQSIFNAFLNYKHAQEMQKNGKSSTPLPEQTMRQTEETQPADAPALAGGTANPDVGNAREAEPTVPEKPTEKVQNEMPLMFKVQFLTAERKLKRNDKRLKDVKDFDCYKEGGLYKYTCGASIDYYAVLRRRKALLPHFKDAFVVAFRGDEKVDINQAIREFNKK